MLNTAEATTFLSARDDVMARLIQAVGPCALKPKYRRTPFAALVRSVVFQQLNGTAAQTILNRFLALYPEDSFPTPEQVLDTPEDRMRSAGLSRAKVAAIKDLAAKTVEGLVPDRREIKSLSDAEIVARLIQVRGVGPWTVEMLLIFTLGRPDVLPVTDYGVRKGFAVTYGWKDLPDPKELAKFGERWKPHRTTAAWYFWRALEL